MRHGIALLAIVCGMRFRVIRADPSIHGQRQRDQAVAKKAATDVSQRENSGNNAAATRHQAHVPASQDAFDDGTPSGKVEERSVGRARHELVALTLFTGRQMLNFYFLAP